MPSGCATCPPRCTSLARISADADASSAPRVLAEAAAAYSANPCAGRYRVPRQTVAADRQRVLDLIPPRYPSNWAAAVYGRADGCAHIPLAASEHSALGSLPTG